MDFSSSRSSFPLFLVLLFYFCPVSIWFFYTYYHSPNSYSWAVAVVGIAIVCMGSALFFSLLRSMEEETAPASVAVIPPSGISPELIEELKASFEEEKNSYLQELEEQKTEKSQQTIHLEEVRAELQKAIEENNDQIKRFATMQNDQAEQLEGKNRRIEELSNQLGHKQLLIQQLENQINDLRYEIKTLLQLTEVDYRTPEAPNSLPPITDKFEMEDLVPIQVTNEDEARKLLKRCIEIAGNMTASYRPSSLNSTLQEPYVFDLRRLKDAFRREDGNLIFVYSSKEDRVLLATSETKRFLGYTSDKFAQEYHQIILEGLFIWKTSLSELIAKDEVAFAIPCKTKSGRMQDMRMMLATIPSGAFRGLIVAVAYNRA